jgi:hypothetical protein
LDILTDHDVGNIIWAGNACVVKVVYSYHELPPPYHAPRTVRSCVLIKLRSKNKFFPSASYGHLVRRASDQEKRKR